METSLIISSAGCGKTTYLIEQMNQELASGIDPKKIAFISFTRSAIRVATQKAKKKFPNLKDEDFQYFKTLHALCFKMLNMTQNRMLDGKMISKFESHMGNIGMDLSVEYDEINALSRKNAPLYLYQVSRHKMCDIEEIYSKDYYDVSLNDVRYAISNYQNFKKAFRVLDFHDLLLNVLHDDKIEPLDVDVVFLDESQDLSALMYAVFYKIFKNAKRIYISGDDFQNLYSWSGADVKNFLNIKYDKKIILETSYRLPSNILDLSKRIVERVPKENRFEKPIRTNKPAGKIEKIFDILDIKDYIIETLLKGESWLILIRNIYLYQRFNDTLYDAGIPFLRFNTLSYKYEDLEAILNYEDYRKGYIPLTDKVKDKLLNYMPLIDLSKTWYEAFTYLGIDDANYYRDIMNSGFHFRSYVKGEREPDKKIKKPQIEITTIHRAKGREADHVLVLPDMSNLTYKMSEIYKDEEHKCFYVASTRSRKSLFLMEPVSQLYYDLNF